MNDWREFIDGQYRVAAGGATEAGTLVLARIRASVEPGQPAGYPASRPPRFAGAGARVARYLEIGIILTASGVIAAGVLLLSLGLTMAIVDGPDALYPNVQHISTQPTPRR